jgi:hypothetical protein
MLMPYLNADGPSAQLIKHHAMKTYGGVGFRHVNLWYKNIIQFR